VPPRTLAARAVIAPNAAILFQSMVGVAWLYVLTFYFQGVLGHGPLAAGLLFLPMTLASVVAAAAAGRLVTSLGPKLTAASGLVLVILGLLLMTRMSAAGGLPFLIAGMVVGEAGFMLANVPLTIVGSTGVSEQRRGLSAGLLNTSTQLGNALGLAVVASVAAVAAGGELVDGLRAGLWACSAFAATALVIVLAALPSRDALSRSG
jgi:Na+/melibiose symporter-like transporter